MRQDSVMYPPLTYRFRCLVSTYLALCASHVCVCGVPEAPLLTDLAVLAHREVPASVANAGPGLLAGGVEVAAAVDVAGGTGPAEIAGTGL